MNECPAPTHLTRVPDSAALNTVLVTSATVVGADREVGCAVTLPVQLVHVGAEVVMGAQTTQGSGAHRGTLDDVPTVKLDELPDKERDPLTALEECLR